MLARPERVQRHALRLDPHEHAAPLAGRIERIERLDVRPVGPLPQDLLHTRLAGLLDVDRRDGVGVLGPDGRHDRPLGNPARFRVNRLVGDVDDAVLLGVNVHHRDLPREVEVHDHELVAIRRPQRPAVRPEDAPIRPVGVHQPHTRLRGGVEQEGDARYRPARRSGSCPSQVVEHEAIAHQLEHLDPRRGDLVLRHGVEEDAAAVVRPRRRADPHQALGGLVGDQRDLARLDVDQVQREPVRGR